MDNATAAFTQTLSSFCNHVEASCDALKQSIDRRPIPLDSASSTFMNRLNRRLSSASVDLNVLDSMSFGTVSFEELLGHCWEVYKKNQRDMAELEDHLKGFGYASEHGDSADLSGFSTPDSCVVKVKLDKGGLDSLCSAGLTSRGLEGSLWDESPSVHSLGLSETSLTALQSKDRQIHKEDMIFSAGISTCHEGPMLRDKTPRQRAPSTSLDDVGELVGASNLTINVSQDDYASLPSYLRSVASWQDLLNAVEKLNVKLMDGAGGGGYLWQHDIESSGLGPQGRSHLLLLVRMKRLIVETKDGVICYKVVLQA